jgi:hypothetical protein
MYLHFNILADIRGNDNPLLSMYLSKVLFLLMIFELIDSPQMLMYAGNSKI